MVRRSPSPRATMPPMLRRSRLTQPATSPPTPSAPAISGTRARRVPWRRTSRPPGRSTSRATTSSTRPSATDPTTTMWPPPRTASFTSRARTGMSTRSIWPAPTGTTATTSRPVRSSTSGTRIPRAPARSRSTRATPSPSQRLRPARESTSVLMPTTRRPPRPM